MKISFCLNAALPRASKTAKTDYASQNRTCTSTVSLQTGSPDALTRTCILGRKLSSLHLGNNLCFCSSALFYIKGLTTKNVAPANCCCTRCYIINVREKTFARSCTWVPLAAGPVKPASQTSSAGGGAEGGPRRPGRGCSAAVAVGGGKLHTAPVGSCHCSPEAGGCWPQPTAGPERAGRDTGKEAAFLFNMFN